MIPISDLLRSLLRGGSAFEVMFHARADDLGRDSARSLPMPPVQCICSYLDRQGIRNDGGVQYGDKRTVIALVTPAQLERIVIDEEMEECVGSISLYSARSSPVSSGSRP